MDLILEDVKNVEVVCSKSGKLTKNLIGSWIECCLIPEMKRQKNDNLLLLLDSWAGQWSEDIWDVLSLPNFPIKRLKISKCTTSEGQPLDVGYNIFFKYLIKRIKEFVDIEEINIDISSRKNVIKLYSLAYDQLNSIQFQPLIRNAWLKAGYDGSNAEIYQNVRDICFNNVTDFCLKDGCINNAFINCSHCCKSLCFDHFFCTKSQSL